MHQTILPPHSPTPAPTTKTYPQIQVDGGGGGMVPQAAQRRREKGDSSNCCSIDYVATDHDFLNSCYTLAHGCH
ncbi:hypothetical protein BDA96_07G094700 [Sorghum bicolor]|uniref:Uncharacterized protein n=2 Tax=Sorghum bicolor TaxID=4558 RepID=A0A921QM63_SORBI|nr:hypothetical protein BDA96_07G094700 [Sorghum bicolor]OQU80159.1 hypothetical protein SORBI_3007G090403 [Sorghum bicolor]